VHHTGQTEKLKINELKMNHEAQCATDRLKHALKKTTLLPLKLRNTNGRKRLAV